MKLLKYSLSAIFFLLHFVCTAQELPPIKNYAPIDYGAGNQNWSISQDDNKYLYFANNNGLLEFNGANWNLYPSPNGTIIRSVNVINNRIYTGCYMEFGYWQRNEFGNLIYHSLIDGLHEPLVIEERFWNIVGFDEWVLFQSLNRIYIYNTVEKTFNILEANTTRAEIFKVGGSIFFQKIDQGIFKIEKGQALLVSEHPKIKNNTLVGAFEMDEKVLFLIESGEFYFLKEGNLERWEISADSDLATKNIYSSLRLRDGSFILGTISNGYYHLDDKGSVIANINQEKALKNNTILSVFEDINHNLWLGLDNGISVVNVDAPFNVYNDRNGNLGAVYTAVLFDDKLYLGTNQGLFYKENNDRDEFKFIKNTNGQVWKLKVIDNVLFCGHNNGTYLIQNDVADLISDFPGTWDIKKIGNSDDLLLQGNYTGISVLEKSNGKWRFKNRVEGFDISSRFVEFLGGEELLINHEFKGLFRIKVDSTFSEVVFQENTPSLGYGSSLVNFNNEIFYASNEGVFKWKTKQQKFLKDSLLTSKIILKDDYLYGKLIADNEAKKLWGFTNKNIFSIVPGKFDSKQQLIKIPIPNSFRKNFGVVGFENLMHIKDDSYLLGTSNGYVIMDLEKVSNPDLIIHINSIEKSILNTKRELVLLNKESRFKSFENNLYLNYSVPEYNKYHEVNYSYQLLGMYDEWTTWSTEHEVSFKNLPFGEYVFNVKARNGSKNSSNVASYSFTIDRPWYLSNEMFIMYFILFGALLLLVHYVYNRNFKKQKKNLMDNKQRELALSRLESEKVIMKLRNEKLRHEIDSKTREVAASTLNIVKKNELLNRIKNELIGVKDNEKIKKVVKIIDKSITDNSDWNLFKKAFNNADRDFLKKIKKEHPALTPSDLRMCAYLRLNLSTKEIAPLLNISPRSVEIKRYRLRKKMELPHEKSLVEFILDV